MHLSIFFFYLSGRQRLRLTKPSDNDFTETLTHLCSVVENVSYKTILEGIFFKINKNVIYAYSLNTSTPRNYLYGIFK